MKIFLASAAAAWRIFGSRSQSVQIPEDWGLPEYRAEGAVFTRPEGKLVLPYHMIEDIQEPARVEAVIDVEAPVRKRPSKR